MAGKILRMGYKLLARMMHMFRILPEMKEMFLLKEETKLQQNQSSRI